MVDVACSGCKQVKDSTFDFYWSQDKRQRYCKECQKTYSKAWAESHRLSLEKVQNHHKRGEKPS